LFINGTDATPASGGSARLVINDGGAVSVAGVTRVWNNGQIEYNGGAFSAGALDLASGANVRMGTGGDKVLRAQAVSIAGAAKVDLSDNNMIIDYTGGSPLAAIRDYIANARNGGAWNGDGITTSAGDASHFGLGYAEAAELGLSLFHDVPVDSTAVVIHYTYYGDANLDGMVDIRDLYQMASHWRTSDDWFCGDFNYDNFVDAADLTLLAINWQAGVPSPSGAPMNGIFASLGLPSVDTPEPGAWGALWASRWSLKRPRRRISAGNGADS
jgi:hypothetical protein